LILEYFFKTVISGIFNNQHSILNIQGMIQLNNTT
jgi:hypothetical protein